MADTKLLKAEQVIKEMKKYIEPERVSMLSSFFKTGKGQYGFGDQFIGVVVPNTRVVARQFTELPLPEVSKLLKHKVHEYRLCALIILVERVERLYLVSKKKGSVSLESKVIKEKHKEIVDFYLAHVEGINSWDLVDQSAHYILGSYLYTYSPKTVVADLMPYALSENLWKRRIAMIATFFGIYQVIKLRSLNLLDVERQKKTEALLAPTFKIAKVLLMDKEDLIQKAVGWMLREAGKRGDVDMLINFLATHHKVMPRTALRYALEKFSPEERKKYM